MFRTFEEKEKTYKRIYFLLSYFVSYGVYPQFSWGVLFEILRVSWLISFQNTCSVCFCFFFLVYFWSKYLKQYWSTISKGLKRIKEAMEFLGIQLSREKGMLFRIVRKMHWFIYIFILLQSQKAYLFNSLISSVTFLNTPKTSENLKYLFRRYRKVKLRIRKWKW